MNDLQGQLPAASSKRTPIRLRARAQGVDLDRVVRRELRPSRAFAAVLAAALITLLATYGLLEAAVHAAGQPSWLMEPQEAAERISSLPDGISPALLGATGSVVSMAGIFFLLQAVLPGRRARHSMDVGRLGLPQDSIAVVADDETIASALARRARLAANVSPEQVMVVVSQKQVLVNVRPTSGAPVSGDAVATAVRRELDSMGLAPFPDVRVVVASTGVIGA